MLLQRLQTEPTLARVSHLVIDEVHERDTLSDFLVTIVKGILPTVSAAEGSWMWGWRDHDRESHGGVVGYVGLLVGDTFPLGTGGGKEEEGTD